MGVSLIKVAALTPGLSNPVSRFRVRQYLEPLRVSGLEVTEYIPALGMYAPTPGGCNPFEPVYWANPLRYLWPALKLAARVPGLVGSRKADLTWQVRTFLDGIPTLEGLLKRPLVFDVDDAIFLKSPWGPQAARSVARRAEAVIAGNQFLADWFSRFHNRVCIIATGVDTERFRPCPEPGPEPEPFVIGWTGTAGNLPYLEAIASSLERFLARYPKTRLLVMADAPPRLPSGVARHLRYVPWSPKVEAPILQQLHVGLMPLPDNDWTRGKCSFKMIQYMATGVPVVVSPVGMNTEVLALGRVGLPAVRDDDWCEALEFLYRHPGEAQAMGRTGRDIAQRHYSNLVIAGQLAAIFRDLV
jgi:glycosyltransferase involved in cell wall biosynthesis